MKVLVTGVGGYVGAALAPILQADGHHVRGFIRSPSTPEDGSGESTGGHDSQPAIVDSLVVGDALSGSGLEEALAGIDVAYYLIHSMESSAGDDLQLSGGGFQRREELAAQTFTKFAENAKVKRVVYLGGLLPKTTTVSSHLRSRHLVETLLKDGSFETVSFRAPLIIAAPSRSFRLIVRFLQRAPVLVLPGWSSRLTQPIDGRDVVEFLSKAATCPSNLCDRTWDIAGPNRLTYRQLIELVAERMLITRPKLMIKPAFTSTVSELLAVLTGEDIGLIRPLMESLTHDLVANETEAELAFGINLHPLPSAIEHALGDLELATD